MSRVMDFVFSGVGRVSNFCDCPFEVSTVKKTKRVEMQVEALNRFISVSKERDSIVDVTVVELPASNIKPMSVKRLVKVG